MEYQGLTTDDLANVRALNRAWLDLHRGDAPASLSRRQRLRLATAPFLLFSLREHDAALWQRLLGDQDQGDLFRSCSPADDPVLDLQVTGLAFLWELTRRNPYVARIVSGAPLPWCEQLAAATLVRVHACARSRRLAESRLAGDSSVHKRLFLDGSGALREPRIAAHLAALHSLLTIGPGARYGRMQAAACRMPEPGRRIADKL